MFFSLQIILPGVFNAYVSGPVLINIAAAEVIHTRVGAEITGKAKLRTQPSTYRRTFGTVVDRITVDSGVVIRVVINVGQLEVRCQRLVIAVSEGITDINTQFVTQAIVDWSPTFMPLLRR